MKRLPDIYKNVVDVNCNLNTFYSKTKSVSDIKREVVVVQDNLLSVRETISNILRRKSYGYTKRVRLTVLDRVIETRLVKEVNDKILTIDNEFIDISDIKKVEVLS